MMSVVEFKQRSPQDQIDSYLNAMAAVAMTAFILMMLLVGLVMDIHAMWVGKEAPNWGAVISYTVLDLFVIVFAIGLIWHWVKKVMIIDKQISDLKNSSS